MQSEERKQRYWSVRSNKYVRNKEGKIVEFCLLKHPGHYGLLTNNEYTDECHFSNNHFIFTKRAYKLSY